ncbi:MAG: cation-translocating P-type ATPase, partial [Flavobacteriaceae bacterium]|nr:cation-translocating P-type ATPase [Flavobacteriaceae bacterium]
MEVEGLIGKGLKAKFNDNIYLLGSPKFMKDNDITSNFDESFMGFSLAKNKKTIANFYFEDPLRSGAHDFGNFLKSSHLKTILLSGDRKEKVEDMRKLFNLDEAIGEVSPSKKSQVIQSLCKNDNFVAMIGDGMNDSSALAYADLGISFQAASDLAKSSSDIILMQNNLNLIQDAFKISYAIKHKILQNYFWAFLYNLIAIPLAMSGQLNPMVAAAAMALSSTSVVLNSLLLKRALK